MKTEELETLIRVDSDENPAPAEGGDAPDQERIEISSDEEERMEVDGVLGNGSQDTSPSEQTVNAVRELFTVNDMDVNNNTQPQPPRRQSTEEPIWETPPCEDSLVSSAFAPAQADLREPDV